MRPLRSAELIHDFLHPDGAALIGRVMATRSPADLISRERARWGDRFYFVNPSGGAVGDQPIYRSVADIPEPVSLAVVSVGVGALPSVLEDCKAAGIDHVVIFTSGFAEVGAEGRRLETEIAALARRLDLVVLGPNTNTNAFEPMPEATLRRSGKIGLITQSGNQGRPFVQAGGLGVAVSRWVATGNEIDLDVSDFIQYFASRGETRVVGAYVEGFQDGRKLRTALQAALDASTPVVMLKIGETEAGRRMAVSHTGHLTGADAVVDGLFRQYAVTRVHDVDELMDTTNMFSKIPIGTGDRVAIYGASGGVTTLLAESAQRHGLRVPFLADSTQDRLGELLPDYLSRRNPVDNGMKFLMERPLEERLAVLRAIGDDPNIDVIVAGNNMAEGPIAEAFVEDLVAFADESTTPIVCVWGTPLENHALFESMCRAEIPIMRSARNAMQALRAVAEYGAFPGRDAEPAREVTIDVDSLLVGAAGPLPQPVAVELLRRAGVTTCEEHLVRAADEAAQVWDVIKANSVMKLSSPRFPHRSDHGLVRLGVSSAEEAASAYDELVERAYRLDPDAPVDGVIIQRQVDDGVELLVGVVNDHVLGPAVTVGFGGVLAEVLADTAVRPVPVTSADAKSMLESLRGYSVLQGVRGRPPVDLDAVVETILAVSDLAVAGQGLLRELDINPLIASESGAVAVDVLAIAGPLEDNDAPS